MTLAALGLTGLIYRIQNQYSRLKPLVIRIDAVGRAEAVDYDAATYKPQAPELRSFLSRFVTTHFSRLRAAVQRDFPDSFFFLEPTLAYSTLAQNEREKTMETFLTNSSADEIDVDIRPDVAATPHVARPDVEKRP